MTIGRPRLRRLKVDHRHKTTLTLIALYIVLFLFYVLVALVTVVLPIGLVVWGVVELILFIMRH